MADEPMPQIELGAYDRLSARDKALVDSILYTNTLVSAARAGLNLNAASPDQLAAKVMLDALEAGRTTTLPILHESTRIGEGSLEMGRDYFAGNARLLEQARQAHLNTPDPELANYTLIVNAMIAIDDDQFQVQRDLPAVLAQSTTDRGPSH